MPLAQASLQQQCNHWQACRHSDRKDRQAPHAVEALIRSFVEHDGREPGAGARRQVLDRRLQRHEASPLGGRWHAWKNLGGAITAAPAVASWGPGRLDVFARGVDNALWQRSFEGVWSGWLYLGGTLATAPVALSSDYGRIDVFTRFTDNALHHRAYDFSWSAWENLGATVVTN